MLLGPGVMRTLNAGGIGYVSEFRQMTRYISTTVQDRHSFYYVQLNRKSYALYRLVTFQMALSGLLLPQTTHFLHFTLPPF